MQPNGSNLLNIIIIIGVVQGFLFNCITFFKNRFSDKTILFLNLLIFFLSANNLQAWLIDSNYIATNFYIKYMHVPWFFFLVPMFYLFLINYLKINIKYKQFLVFTLVLFLFALIIRLVVLIYLDTYNYITIDVVSFMEYYNLIEETIIFVYSILVFLYTILVVFRHKKELLFILDFDNLNWIKVFLLFSILLIILWVEALYKSYELATFNPSKYYDPIKISISILIYWLGYHGIQQHKFIKNRISIRNLFLSQTSIHQCVNVIDEKNIINPKNDDYFVEINNYIVVNKKYNDANLSLESLTQELKISTSYLSSIINKNNKSNFTDYINEYRINQVKQLLKNPEYWHYKILSIGLESGFNSKSTFYAAFKKFTGKTPLQFKKSALKPDKPHN